MNCKKHRAEFEAWCDASRTRIRALVQEQEEWTANMQRLVEMKRAKRAKMRRELVTE